MSADLRKFMNKMINELSTDVPADKKIDTAVRMAKKYKLTSFVENLLKMGTIGYTVDILQWACETNAIDIVKQSIDNGIDVNVKFDSINKHSLLTLCALHGYDELIKFLLEKGADINYVNDIGRFPLLYTYMYNKISCAKILIDAGADINIKFETRSLLYYAVANSSTELIELLMSKGVGLNTESSPDFTPLTQATWLSDQKIVEFLLKNGADPLVKNARGKIAIDYSSKYPSIHKLLTDAMSKNAIAIDSNGKQYPVFDTEVVIKMVYQKSLECKPICNNVCNTQNIQLKIRKDSEWVEETIDIKKIKLELPDNKDKIEYHIIPADTIAGSAELYVKFCPDSVICIDNAETKLGNIYRVPY